MRTTNKLKLAIIVILIYIATILTVKAQPPGWENHPMGGAPPHSRPCWPPPCVPVDNYVFVIIIGAVALAGFFYKREIE